MFVHLTEDNTLEICNCVLKNKHSKVKVFLNSDRKDCEYEVNTIKSNECEDLVEVHINTLDVDKYPRIVSHVSAVLADNLINCPVEFSGFNKYDQALSKMCNEIYDDDIDPKLIISAEISLVLYDVVLSIFHEQCLDVACEKSFNDDPDEEEKFTGILVDEKLDSITVYNNGNVVGNLSSDPIRVMTKNSQLSQYAAIGGYPILMADLLIKNIEKINSDLKKNHLPIFTKEFVFDLDHNLVIADYQNKVIRPFDPAIDKQVNIRLLK